MKPIQAYECDFCNHREFYNNDMVLHESECLWNPNNKRCQTCKHHAESESKLWQYAKCKKHKKHIARNLFEPFAGLTSIDCELWEVEK